MLRKRRIYGNLRKRKWSTNKLKTKLPLYLSSESVGVKIEKEKGEK